MGMLSQIHPSPDKEDHPKCRPEFPAEVSLKRLCAALPRDFETHVIGGIFASACAPNQPARRVAVLARIIHSAITVLIHLIHRHIINLY